MEITPEFRQHLLTAPLADLLAQSRRARAGQGAEPRLTWSRKVFIPLTRLCRDVCHYCTFATAPKSLESAYLSIDQMLDIARAGASSGCKEALFTLGDKPELRYPAARKALDNLGFPSTVAYLAHAAKSVLEETGLLPHINAGVLTEEDYALLRPVSASMGLMLESASDRLCQRGGPHFGSPDKDPAVRLASIEAAGKARIPFTSGILVGIGETADERIDALAELARLHARHGHIQEVIVQNFQPKPGTRMADAAPVDEDELLRAVAFARLIMPAEVSVQTPPNLNPARIAALIGAGLNDWGGISPVTIDHVNPEAAWPEVAALAQDCAAQGFELTERLTAYPRFVQDAGTWMAPRIAARVRQMADGEGLARDGAWSPGGSLPAPGSAQRPLGAPALAPQAAPDPAIARALRGETLDEGEVVRLLTARGAAAEAIVAAADELRRSVRGDAVTYVVNRNINYTNICSYACTFCAFSKSSSRGGLREKPYDLNLDEIGQRVAEARARGASEVCLQGGIHPRYTGQTYIDIVRAVKRTCPDMHVHAFSPLEIEQGATTLDMPVSDYLARLRDEGLGSLPGTAAEILDDEIRALICPDKLTTARWLEIVGAAHAVGLPTTATIMFGHCEAPHHVARHLLRVRELQLETGGFTEFVPLPFVHMQSPMFLRGQARMGPTWREVVLMHAVSRLVLHGAIGSIQASWVKLGLDGAAACLAAGVNDLGGVLMNESISRAAGAVHGQELSVEDLAEAAAMAGRRLERRTTLYGKPAEPEPAGAGPASGCPAPALVI